MAVFDARHCGLLVVMFVTIHFCTYQGESFKTTHFPHDPQILISSFASLLRFFLLLSLPLSLCLQVPVTLSFGLLHRLCLCRLVERNSHRWQFGTFKSLTDATYFLARLPPSSTDRSCSATKLTGRSDFSVIWAGCRPSKPKTFVNKAETEI